MMRVRQLNTHFNTLTLKTKVEFHLNNFVKHYENMVVYLVTMKCVRFLINLI